MSSNVNQSSKKFIKDNEDTYNYMPLIKGKESVRSDAGAIAKTSNIVLLKKTSIGVKAVTLADGKEGQEMRILMTQHTASGASVVTPTNLNGGATLSFDAVGETATLFFYGGAWNIISLNGTTLG